MKYSTQTLTVSFTLFLVGIGINGLSQAQSLPPQPRLDGPSFSTVEGASPSSSVEVIPAGDSSLPPQGVPGKCYVRVWEAPVYGTETEKRLARQASERIEIIPAEYTWIEEKVLVREAYEREEVIPAVHETVPEQILVKPANTRWKKGRGLVEKVDNFTGEIMCLIEVPAEYKTITTTVVKTPATKKLIQVPAEYKTVKVEKLVKPAQEKRIPIPATYQTVERTVLKSPGRMVWKSVICETNAPHSVKPLSVKATEPAFPVKEIDAEPSSSFKAKSDDWFFLWDYDKLFEEGKLEQAERKSQN